MAAPDHVLPAHDMSSAIATAFPVVSPASGIVRNVDRSQDGQAAELLADWRGLNRHSRPPEQGRNKFPGYSPCRRVVLLSRSVSKRLEPALSRVLNHLEI